LVRPYKTHEIDEVPKSERYPIEKPCVESGKFTIVDLVGKEWISTFHWGRHHHWERSSVGTCVMSDDDEDSRKIENVDIDWYIDEI
jgi:hypothetical protein